MNHAEKIEALAHMLVLSGHIRLLRSDEDNCWVTMLYGRQENAARSLEKWSERPIVVAALVRRWMEMDEGEGVIPAVSEVLVNALGREACILESSNLYYTFCPDQRDEAMWRLYASGFSTPATLKVRDRLASEFAKAITWVYCQRKLEICREVYSLNESKLVSTLNCARLVQGSEQGILAAAHQAFSLALPIATCRWGRLFGEPWLPAWHEILTNSASPSLKVLALMIAYVGPTYICSSFADRAIVDTWEQMFESAPVVIPADASEVRMGSTIDSPQDSTAAEILERLFPGVKAWLDLDMARQTFDPNDPQRFKYVELLLSEPQVKMVYHALDCTEWPDIDIAVVRR